jgi:hypothetical protein
MVTRIITREILKDKNFTNINNINYNNNNNNNNDNNTNHCVVLADSQAMEETKSVTPTAPSGLASLSASQDSGEVICSGVGNPATENLPRNWRGIKFDLFDNKPGLKLKVSVIKNDGTTQELVSALNSPVDYIWRSVPAKDLHKSHWVTVKQLETELKQSGVDYKASKLATPRKGSSTDMITFLTEINGHWNLFLVLKGAVYEYILNENITPAQRNAKVIASVYVGRGQKKLLTVEDLGL